MSYIHQGNFRAADNEFIDMNDKEARGWLTKHYPAIMAERPVGMSDGYQFMPSHRIASTLQNEFKMNLVAVGQQYSRARNPAGQEHFMKFRPPTDLIDMKQVGDSAPEIVITNSHNGRSVIKAYAGIFRLVCSNGMVVSEASFGEIELRHFGEQNSFEAFSKMLATMAGRMELLGNRIAKMQSTLMTRHEENQLAKMIIEARGAPDWVEAKDVLTVHRPEDDYDEDGARDLWRTFNVIQENMTSRRVQMERQEGARLRSLRPLTGARAEILTNERIWTALDKFIEDRKDRFGDIAQMIADARPVAQLPVAEEQAGQEEAVS